MRKVVVHHLFSAQKIRSFRLVREDEVSAMIAGILNKANSNEVVDIGDAVSSFNWNVLCRVAFGKKLDRCTRSGGRFEKNTGQLMAVVVETFFAQCVVFGWISKLYGAARRVEKIFEDMDSFYQQVIDEHLNPDRPDSMTNDILDLLIQLREDHSSAIPIDWKQIKAIIMNVFVAGTDSTRMSLIWAMTCLMKSPSAMRKVQQEVRSLVGKKGFVDEDDVEKLPYLKAVIKETMRLYPAVPLIPREVIEACIIDGYEIEAKMFVIVNVWAIGRDDEFWENADEFLPEALLEHKLQYGFIPFGSGRRICLGASLAIANMEVALSNLVYFFNWATPHGNIIDTNTSPGLVLHKKNPLSSC